MADEPAPRIFQKGYLPPDLTRWNSDVAESVNVNRFPLGDISNFSVARVCNAILAQKRGASADTAWDTHARWEKQYLSALNEVRYKAQGDQVSGQDGAYLAPEAWSDQFFGLLRQFTVFDRLPVTRFKVPARVYHIPKVTNDITAYYPGENAQITASQFSFGQLSYTARKSTALINVSTELMRDAPDMADNVLRRQAAEFAAWDRDTQLLTGQGGPNPVGLLTMATNGTVSKYYAPTSPTGNISATAAHGTPSFLHLSQLRSKVANLNGSTLVTAGQARCTGVVIHSRFEQTVHTLATTATAWTDAQGRPLWMAGLNADGTPNPDGGGKGSLLGLNWALTNILPVNSTDGGGTASSFAIAGWWEQYALFECPTLLFDVTEEAQGFGSYQTQVKIISRFDGSPAHPEAFAVLAGVDQ